MTAGDGATPVGTAAPGGAAESDRRVEGRPLAGPAEGAGESSGHGRSVETRPAGAGAAPEERKDRSQPAEQPRRPGAGRRGQRGAIGGSGEGQPMLLGVRHHGPGSARAVRAALASHEPAVLLVEGPPEAEAVLELAADPAMCPPVALLAHARDEPGKAAFWPFAGFSPEWVAIRWARERGVPVRFIDLPAAHTLALPEEEPIPEEEPLSEEERHSGGAADGERPGGGKNPRGPEPPGDRAGSEERGASSAEPEAGRTEGGGRPGRAEAPSTPAAEEQPTGHSLPPMDRVRSDPLAALAEAAGYDDPERWWEDAVEHRVSDSPYAPFTALAEAMGALRETLPQQGHHRDLLRESHMRLRLREAQREFGAEAVAVVCGAWHVPALARRHPVTADRQALKGLPKVKTEVTWVPWTHRRLARHSGYGAGITSPGWYAHLFSAPDRPVERWMTEVAGLLRRQDHSVSSAHVIEAVRLADSLAAMRGRPLAGLSETTDAVRAVMCEGSDVPLALVHDQLIVGDVLGEVPDRAPAVPLQHDLAKAQRRLRLKPEAAERELDLDLRGETDAARSRLLHRLSLLGIGWGEPARDHGGTGTFREKWRLRWEPELSVRVAEAGVWGTTVLGAATAKAIWQAGEAAALSEVTSLAERCLLAELPDALPTVMRALADRAALDTNVGQLAQALPALVRSVRYGDVRGSDARQLAEVAGGLAERICVGLPPACVGLDADGAQALRDHIDAVHQSVNLLAQGRSPASETARPGEAKTDDAEHGPRSGGPASGPGGPEPGPEPGHGSDSGAGAPGPVAETGRNGWPTDTASGLDGLPARWCGVLRSLSERERVPGLLRGRCTRLLLDGGELAEEETARAMGLALSPGSSSSEAAAWIEGFLAGGGMLLVHDERLLALVDDWLAGVADGAFTEVLPLLRRTFSEFEPGVRRSIGDLVRRGIPRSSQADAATGRGVPALGAAGAAEPLDTDRAGTVLPVLRLLLGQQQPGASGDLRPPLPAAVSAADGPEAQPRAAHPASGGTARPASGPAAGGVGDSQRPPAAAPMTEVAHAGVSVGAEPSGADASRGSFGGGVLSSSGGGDRREVLRRWRLVLGGAEQGEGAGPPLSGTDAEMDRVLEALYGGQSTAGGKQGGQGGRSGRNGGLGASAPQVARWLGDIRSYFPSSVVQVMQRDAIGRLGLSSLLLEPEMLESVQADVHLVGTLLSLNRAMPETSRETARAVVRKVVQELERRLATKTRSTLSGALDRSARIHRPRYRDIDWNRTIRANLKNYLPEYGTVVPERLIGYGRAAQAVRKEVILCIDQSGSMASSVVYASVFGAVLASMRSLDTRIVVFDTSVVDLTDDIADPVDVLFGTQLGGGTDINRALAYCQSQISRPTETVVVLISDLYEGGIREGMLKRVAAMRASGVQFVSLLALSDEGAPSYDRDHASALAALGAPAFACTPDHFPEVMAAALEKRPLPVPDGLE